MGEWDEPGLFAALDGASVSHETPGGTRVPNATFEAWWGPVVLGESTYTEGEQGSVTFASIWNGEELAVSVAAGEGPDKAREIVRVLLTRLAVPDAEQDRYVEEIAVRWEEPPPGVANAAMNVPFTSAVDWSAVPRAFFPEGLPAPEAHGDRRMLREGAWRIIVQVGSKVLDEGDVRVEISADDHALATVQMVEGERRESAFARINTTLEKAGARTATFGNFSGGEMTC